MRVRVLTSALVAVIALLCGCATTSHPAAEANTQTAGMATCCVCRYNNDLACVEFRLKGTTPKTEYHGTTYCFCSKSCQAAFAKKPAKYARPVASGAATTTAH